MVGLPKAHCESMQIKAGESLEVFIERGRFNTEKRLKMDNKGNIVLGIGIFLIVIFFIAGVILFYLFFINMELLTNNSDKISQGIGSIKNIGAFYLIGGILLLSFAFASLFIKSYLNTKRLKANR
jgi:hypothetical protein